jgi:hypothetical protein
VGRCKFVPALHVARLSTCREGTLPSPDRNLTQS